ncbi:hypothetical protein KCU89_g53, partial [Aureobasidium melanogenum]
MFDILIWSIDLTVLWVTFNTQVRTAVIWHHRRQWFGSISLRFQMESLVVERDLCARNIGGISSRMYEIVGTMFPIDQKVVGKITSFD